MPNIDRTDSHLDKPHRSEWLDRITIRIFNLDLLATWAHLVSFRKGSPALLSISIRPGRSLT